MPKTVTFGQRRRIWPGQTLQRFASQGAAFRKVTVLSCAFIRSHFLLSAARRETKHDSPQSGPTDDFVRSPVTTRQYLAPNRGQGSWTLVRLQTTIAILLAPQTQSKLSKSTVAMICCCDNTFSASDSINCGDHWANGPEGELLEIKSSPTTNIVLQSSHTTFQAALRAARSAGAPKVHYTAVSCTFVQSERRLWLFRAVLPCKTRLSLKLYRIDWSWIEITKGG